MSEHTSAAPKKAAKKAVKKAATKSSARKKPAASKQRAKPISYTKAIGDRICDLLAEGQSLRTICSAPDMPVRSTVFQWLLSDDMKHFKDQYAQARQDQASHYAAQVIDIADEQPTGMFYIDEGGNRRVDSGFVQHQRARIDARKWYASKVAPKKYGDKVDLNVGGQEDNPLKVLYEQISGSGFAPKDDE